MQALGIEDRDVPKLADHLLKYNQQQREQAEVRRAASGLKACTESGLKDQIVTVSSLQDVCAESSDMAKDTSATANMASELINPNHVLPALKSFFEQHRKSKYDHMLSESSFLKQ